MYTSTMNLHVQIGSGMAAHLQRLQQIADSKKTKEEREREEKDYQALKRWLLSR